MKENRSSRRGYSFVKLFFSLIILICSLNKLSYGLTTEETQKKATCSKCSDAVQKTRSGEIERIKCWLECLGRKPGDDEKTLYTWGHKDKINDMKSLTKDLFYAKDYARQNKREEVNYSFIYNKSTKEEILEAKNANDFLLDLISIQQAKETLDSKSLNITAMNKLYPGYIENLKKDRKEELKDKEKEYKESCEKEKGIPSKKCVILQGEIIGIKTSTAGSTTDTSAGSGQLSSGSTGKGVYMDNTLRYISHLPDQGGGLACKTDSIKFINLNPKTPEGMMNYHIFQDIKILLSPTMTGVIYNPTQYNIWVAPDILEEAISGYLLTFSTREPIYVSKKAIDFSTALGSCRDILMTDFNDTYFSDLMKVIYTKKGLLFMLIGSMDSKKHDPQLVHLGNLINKSAKKCEYVKQLLDTITKEGLLNSIYMNNANSKTSLENMMKDCGCSVLKGEVVCTKK